MTAMGSSRKAMTAMILCITWGECVPFVVCISMILYLPYRFSMCSILIPSQFYIVFVTQFFLSMFVAAFFMILLFWAAVCTLSCAHILISISMYFSLSQSN